MKKKRERRSGFFWKLILLMALAVFIFSGYQLYSIAMEYKAGVEEYSEISNAVVNRQPQKSPITNDKNDTNVTKPQKGQLLYAELPDYAVPEVDFEELKQINKDVIGWIEVEAIPEISYPIVQAEDNDYYLKRTIYGNENSAGSIFIDYTNSDTFKDCNTVIYGHNMKNGSMFGQLSDLYEQEKYKISQYIWICTPNGKYRYEIFSMQYAHVNSNTYQFYQTHGDEFQAYLIEMTSKSVVDLQTPLLSKEDYIITLSTCTSDSNTRFVVQARWIGTY